MSKHKRSPLGELARSMRAEPSRPAAPAGTGGAKLQFTLRLHPAVREVLRQIAHEGDRSMHSVLMDGVDLVLAQHGQPAASEIVGAARASR